MTIINFIIRICHIQFLVYNHERKHISKTGLHILFLYGASLRPYICEDKVSCSLRNLGNTCYLNALIHVLTRIPFFRQWCFEHQETIMGSEHKSENCALCTLAYDLSCVSTIVN